MDMKNIPCGTADQSRLEPAEHKGEPGVALWRTQQFDHLRVRWVESSPGCPADRWSSKGPFLPCLE